MSIVTERMNEKSRPITDRLQGKARGDTSPSSNGNGTLASALPKHDHNDDLSNNCGFFGAFMPKQSHRGMISQVPTVLKASGKFSEREQIETEVISN
jgi:hypothetical protein